MKLKLVAKKSESDGVTSFIFEPSEKFIWQAGQYLHYVLHHKPTDSRGPDRWFTIASAPFEEKIMLTTRFASHKGSSFKRFLANMKIKQEIEVLELDGDFVFGDPTRKYVFIAGGIGITPFRAILKELDHQKKSTNIILLYANKDREIIYKKELETIAENNHNLKIHYIFSPDHIDENKIKQFIPDIKEPFFYISGPEAMVENLGNILKAMGIPENHIKQDWFPGYSSEL